MGGIYFDKEATILGSGVSGLWQGVNTRDSQTRPMRIRPLQSQGAGTVDDYFCYYRLWQFQDNGEENEDQSIKIPQFPGSPVNFELDRRDGDSQNASCDILIVRKSDRKAVRITGNMTSGSSLIYTDVSNNANYPELQRLRLLGII